MTSGTAPPRLVVEGLTVRAMGSGAAIIEDVSVEVAAGEVLGVVGESGSGKTTLGLAMVGHARRGLEIASGSVRLDGTGLSSLPADELRRLRGAAMTYIPQDPSSALNPALRVGGMLKEVLTAHGRTDAEAAARVQEVLAEVGLGSRPEILSVYPHQLSGGQQQRVAIAMAFACRPRLIVLDEPTTGLDVTTQRMVLETVARMCASYGVAAVYVSHDVVVVGELSNRARSFTRAGWSRREQPRTCSAHRPTPIPRGCCARSRRLSVPGAWSVWRESRRAPGTARRAAVSRPAARSSSNAAQ